MGREGRTQRALERRNNVSINIGTQTITIRGQKENQEHTIDDIQTKIDNISESHTNKEKQTICRFYERGNCKKGDRCNFDHPRPSPSHRSRSPRRRSHSRPREEHSPTHHRQRIDNKRNNGHEYTHRDHQQYRTNDRHQEYKQE